MSRWFRVFGTAAAGPEPAALLEHLQGVVPDLRGKFRGDDQGWFSAELIYPGGTLELERYLTSEEGIRAELNSWAAWVETNEDNPHHGRLMQQIISTAQLFTMQVPDGQPDSPAENLCQFLAGATEGVYQVDGQGFFAADGTLLLKE